MFWNLHKISSDLSRSGNPNDLKSWDRFTQSSNDNTSSDDIKFWDTVFIVTKITVAILLFFFTLGTAVICKICFIMITTNIFPSTNSNDTVMDNKLKTLNGTLSYKDSRTNVQWIWALILLTGTPYLFATMKALWRYLFQISNSKSPDFATIISVSKRFYI